MNALQYFDWGFSDGDFVLRGGKLVEAVDISIMGTDTNSVFENVDFDFSKTISCQDSNSSWYPFAAKLDREHFVNQKQTLRLDENLKIVRIEHFDENCYCEIGSTDFKYFVLTEKDNLNTFIEINGNDKIIYIEDPYNFSLKTNFASKNWNLFLFGSLIFVKGGSSPSCRLASSNLIFIKPRLT
jgi:hypothetical protein|nr:MAG TPA: hypothetical protein [Caudoviricetes sp.]